MRYTNHRFSAAPARLFTLVIASTLRSSNHAFAALLCIALLAGCAAQTRETKPTDVVKVENPAPLPDSADAQFHVMAGEMAAGRHLPGVAAKEFLEALKTAPDAKLAARTTALALAANDEDLGLTAAKRWLEIEPSALDAREVITMLEVRKGHLAEAYAQCEAIVDDHPGGEADGLRHVALMLASEAQHKELVLALMQKLADDHAKLAGAHYAFGLVAMRFNELNIAEKAARQALKLDPKSTDAQMLLAGVQVKQG